MFEVRFDGKMFSGDDFLRLQIHPGINIKPGWILEELAQTTKQAAFALVIKAFVENLDELGRPDRQPDRAVGIARKIPGESMEPAEVGYENGLSQSAQRISAVEEIVLFNHLPGSQMAQRHFHEHDRLLAF